jgi:hypothetical protein
MEMVIVLATMPVYGTNEMHVQQVVLELVMRMDEFKLGKS